MVKITIPDVTAKLSTKTTPLQTPSDFTRIERASQQAFGQLAQTAEIFRQGIVTEQVSLATLSVNEQMNQLELDYKSNPSLTGEHANQFSNDANNILQKQLDTIGDPQVTRQFEVQQRAKILGQTNSVRTAGRKAQVDRYTVQTNEIETQSVNSYLNEADPAKQFIIKQDYINQLNRGVDNLFMSREERQRRIGVFDEGVRLGKPQVDLDTMVESQGSLGAERFKGIIESRKVYDLNEKEIESFLDQADNVINREKAREKQEVEARQEKNLDAVIDDLIFTPKGEQKATVLSLEALRLTGQLKDKDATNAIKVLNLLKGVNVTTDVGFYDSVQDMRTGFRTKPNGQRFSTAEIKSTILENLDKISATDAKGVLDDLRRNQDAFNTDIEKNALLKVKAFAQENILKNTSIFFATGEAKGLAQGMEFQYHEQRIREGATGQRLYEIAQEVIDNFKRTADTEFDPQDPKTKDAKIFQEGDTIINIKTGERMKVIGGKWVPVR